MAEAPPVEYVRLPGSGISRKGGSYIAATRTSCRLWLGDDHLLQVESVGGYSESYKRFYFRDIQVLYLHKTKSWLVVNIVLGVFTALFVLLGLATGDEAGMIALGIIAGIFGFFLLLNLGRGSTCRCHLKTAVHLEELPSLGRRRNAEKVLARLKPLIEASQGSATAETLAPQYQVLLAAANLKPAVPGQFVRVVDPTLSIYQGRSHLMLFIALLVAAIADTLNIFLPGVPVVLLELLAGATLAGVLLVALVKQQSTDLKLAVRVVTWFAAGFVGLGYITGYVVMFLITGRHDVDSTQWGYIKGIAELQPLEKTWWLVILIVSATLSGVLGATGLLLLRQHWREKEAMP